MYKGVLVLLVVALAGLQYRLWIADGGLSEVHRLELARDKLGAANDRNRARNDAMQAQVDDLKAGQSATEGRARADMGMIKRDETFFLTVAPRGDRTANRQASR